MNSETGLHRYEAEILVQIAGMRAVAAAWNRLAAQAGSPLLSADWFIACAEALSAETDLRVVVVRSGGVICAVAPLVVVRRNGVEWLELLGTSALYEPSGFLYDDVPSLQCLVNEVASLRMPVLLVRIPAESPLRSVVRGLACYKVIVLNRNTASTAHIDRRGTWEEYYQSISGQRRYDYQRKQKRTKRFGEITIKIERPSSPTELQPMLAEVFRIEGIGWKGRAGSALLSNAHVRRVVSRYSEMACERGELRICFLEVGGAPIATLLAVEYARRFWVLKMGYDERWAQCSPGIQLTLETIRYVFEQGLEGYEFLGSEESWQMTWPHDSRAFLSLVLYPISIRGLLALTGDLRRVLVRKAQQFVPNVETRMNRKVQEN